jgi:hypothetical protein
LPCAQKPGPKLGTIVMNSLVSTTTLIPFDGFELDDGETSRSGAEYAKFDAAAQHLWHGRTDGARLNLGPYWCVNLFPEILKWDDQKVVDRILPKPGKSFPTSTSSTPQSTRKIGTKTSTAILNLPASRPTRRTSSIRKPAPRSLSATRPSGGGSPIRNSRSVRSSCARFAERMSIRS